MPQSLSQGENISVGHVIRVCTFLDSEQNQCDYDALELPIFM